MNLNSDINTYQYTYRQLKFEFEYLSVIPIFCNSLHKFISKFSIFTCLVLFSFIIVFVYFVLYTFLFVFIFISP